MTGQEQESLNIHYACVHDGMCGGGAMIVISREAVLSLESR
jgi:hypothetical protein